MVNKLKQMVTKVLSRVSRGKKDIVEKPLPPVTKM